MKMREVLDKIGFPVHLEELVSRPSGFTSDYNLAVVRPDISRIIGLVSKKYQLVQHSTLLKSPLKYLESEGFTFPCVSLGRQGATVLVEGIGSKVTRIEDDQIVLALSIINSYNLENSVKFSFGAFNLRNMTRLSPPISVVKAVQVNYRKKHQGKVQIQIKDDLPQEVLAYNEIFQDVIKYYKSLTQVELPEELVAEKLKRIFSDRAATNILGKYQQEPKKSLWSAYKAVCRFLKEREDVGKSETYLYRVLRNAEVQQNFFNEFAKGDS